MPIGFSNQSSLHCFFFAQQIAMPGDYFINLLLYKNKIFCIHHGIVLDTSRSVIIYI